MLREYKRPLATSLRLVDIFVLLTSVFVAYYIRFDSLPLNILSLPTEFQIFLLTSLGAWIYFSNSFKLYTSKRMSSFTSEAFDVCKATTACLVTAILPALFIRTDPLSRLFLLYLWPVLS